MRRLGLLFEGEETANRTPGGGLIIFAGSLVDDSSDMRFLFAFKGG